MTHPFDTSYDVSFISSPVLADSRKIADYAFTHEILDRGMSPPMQGHGDDYGAKILDLGFGIGLCPQLIRSVHLEVEEHYTLNMNLYFGDKLILKDYEYGYPVNFYLFMSDDYPSTQKNSAEFKEWLYFCINQYINNYMPAFKEIASTPRNEMTLERGLELLDPKKLKRMCNLSFPMSLSENFLEYTGPIEGNVDIGNGFELAFAFDPPEDDTGELEYRASAFLYQGDKELRSASMSVKVMSVKDEPTHEEEDKMLRKVANDLLSSFWEDMQKIAGISKG